MKKILFFSRDPGAANVIIPVFKKMESNESLSLHLYGKEFALDKYKESNCDYVNLLDEVERCDLDHIKNLLLINGFDLVVTGTTTNDDTDRLLWKAANDIGIPSLAILDQWIDYVERFTMRTDNSGMVLPRYISVMDEYASVKMRKLGFPEEIVVVTGQPYFETTANLIEGISDNKLRKILDKYCINDDEKVVLFAAEPLIESYENPLKRGYNQMTILSDLIPVIKDWAEEHQQRIVFCIKPHPRNDLSTLSTFIENGQNTFRSILTEESPQEMIKLSDAVIGMSSMMLLEATIASRPILSVQIGLSVREPFLLAQIGKSTPVYKKADLPSAVAKLLGGSDENNGLRFTYIEKATFNISSLIEKIVL